MKKYLALAAVTLAGLGSAAQAATIADASFESPSLAPATFSYDPAVTGASFVGNAGVVFVASNGSTMNLPTAPDGNQAAFIQGYAGANGSFSVNVSDLVAGTPYVLSFLAAEGYAPNPFTVSFNGMQIGSYSVDSSAYSAFTTQSFIPTGTSGTLTFTGSHTTANTLVGIDDLTFGAVPEPKSWAMLIVGFAAIGMMLRARPRRFLQLA